MVLMSHHQLIINTTTKSMLPDRNQSQLMEEITRLRSRLKRSPKSDVENMVQYMGQVLTKRHFLFCGGEKATADPYFLRAFNACQRIDKAKYYLMYLEAIERVQQKAWFEEPGLGEELIVVVRSDHSKKEWNPCSVALDPNNLTLEIRARGLTLHMKDYLIRQSKYKYREALVLQNCANGVFPETMRMSCDSHEAFQQLRILLTGFVRRSLQRKLSKMLGQPRAQTQPPLRSVGRQSLSGSLMIDQRRSLRDMLRQKTLNMDAIPLNSIHHSMVSQDTIDSMDNYTGYEEVHVGVFWNAGEGRIRKTHEFRPGEGNVEWVSDTITHFQLFKLWKAALFMVTQLADIQDENSRIFHEIDVYSDKTQYDYVFLRHKFNQGSTQYLIDKSISTVEYGTHQASGNRGKVEYCLWRVKKNGNGVVELVVEAQINYAQMNGRFERANQFIGELDNLWACRRVNRQVQGKDCFKVQAQDGELISSAGSNLIIFNSYEQVDSPQKPPSQQISQRFYSIDASQFFSIASMSERGSRISETWQFSSAIQEGSENIMSKQGSEMEETGVPTMSIEPTKPVRAYYLYKVTPQEPNQVDLKPRDGLVIDPQQSVVTEKGEWMFVNEKKIQAQSSVMKSIVKRIGTNLFSGKSILNISLPIQIFATDTHLQRLCRAFAFAPHFFQRKDLDGLGRMKAAISCSIGVVLLYTEMAKPFNPILGETYQAFIKGCPIYGQQISHHPPISALFMKGRGYTVQAQLEATIEFGLNKASGINKGFYRVSFDQDDPTKKVVVFQTPPGQLHGVVYGQRKLFLNGKTRFYDQQEGLFCQLVWGKGKNKNTIEKYEDYLEGKIIKLPQGQIGDLTKVKTSKNDNVIATVKGRWTDRIFCQEETLFEVGSVAPFKIQEEQHSLPSDGRWRKDRALLEDGRMEDAQVAKEQLENIQRRDRKLRKQMYKG